ncbi:MAG: hypothetical protein ACR2MB_13450 [Acidimicrobiales bacterium]
MPSGIIASGEYRRHRIGEAYLRLLGRTASPSSVAFWSGQVARGMSYETFERRLLSSTEFARRHPSDAVAALYQVVLGRAPTAHEVDAAGYFLASGRSFASVVLATQHSTEGFDRVIGTFCQPTVGHGPSPLLRYYWQAELRKVAPPSPCGPTCW